MKPMASAIREALNKKTDDITPTKTNISNVIRESLYKGVPCPNKQAMIVGVEEELKAILLYEKLLLNATNDEVRELLTHIIDEERHHVEEFSNLLGKLNGDFK